MYCKQRFSANGFQFSSGILFVVPSVRFFAHDREICPRFLKWIGLPRKPNRRHLDLCFELTRSAKPRKAKLSMRIVVSNPIPGRFPNHLECHLRRCSDGIQRGPPRLINDRDVLHFQSEGAAIRTDRKAALWHRNDPIKSGGCNGRVKVVDLVCRDRRSLEQGQSYMGERPLLCCSGCPVFALHHAVVGGRCAKGDTISSIVGTHTGKSAAASDTTLEVINVRRFEIGACWLIVTAILIQPRNRIRIGTAVCSSKRLIREGVV